MESVGDKIRAALFALLVHAGCVAVMFIGLLWTHTVRPVSVPGAVIQAELVGLTQAPKPRAPHPKPVTAEPSKPVPAEPKNEPQAAEQQRQEMQERERVAAMAQQQAEQKQREQDERRHQEQVLLEEKQREEQARKDRELEKKLEVAKHERELAEKKRKLEQEKLAQLLDQQKKHEREHQAEAMEAEQRKTGTNGQDNSMLAEYVASIQNSVRQNWNRPDSAPRGLRCSVRVIQIPGGDVISANVVDPCNADLITRTSIEQAVTKAQPLPYKGYETVFARELTFIFTYNGN